MYCICPVLKASLSVSITLVRHIFSVLVKIGSTYTSIWGIKVFHLVLRQASIWGCIWEAKAVSVLLSNLYGV